MNPFMDYQFARDHDDTILSDRSCLQGYYDDQSQGEYFDSNQGYYEQDELVNYEMNPNSMNEEISCCPMEIIHRRRHSLSYRPNLNKGVRRKDTSKIPKFRNPWDVQGELQPKRSKDVPLSYDEARFIREIWQDTRAQYEPSDGEIEEEFLFEEEYNDFDAEKRRNMLVKKGANLVRYSRHYELPTISTIIKSSNPEQFRSRSFSPSGSRARASGSNFNRGSRRNSRSQARRPTLQQYKKGVREDLNFENGFQNQYALDGKYEDRERLSRAQNMQYEVGNSMQQVQVRGTGSMNQENPFPREVSESNFVNNRCSEATQNEALRGGQQLMTPVSSRHRNTALGIPSEFADHLNGSNANLSVSAASRRATTPDILSPTKSTGRGPPPKIGVLEPVETSEGLVSPVNHHKIPVINTPRIGNMSSRSASSSILGRNKHNFDNLGVSPSDRVPVISPTGRQTIVFHMIPESNGNNSKATIFADPDSQNIVTELHIKPGVDINVTSTPTGPAIEYEISGGRNAKAHINFSSGTNPDSTLSIGDIPKIQTLSEFQEQQIHSHGPNSSNMVGHNHGYLNHSRSQSRRRSSQEGSGTKTHQSYQNSDFSSGFGGSKGASSSETHLQHHTNSHVGQNQHMGGRERRSELGNPLSNNSKILNNTMDEAGRIFSEIERDIQNQYGGVAAYQVRGDAPEYLGFEQGSATENEVGHSDQLIIQPSQNESGLLEKGANCDEVLHKEKFETKESEGGSFGGTGIAKVHPNPFLPVKRIQKRSGFSGCILNTLTCSKVESNELKTFRALNPVEMISRGPEYY